MKRGPIVMRVLLLASLVLSAVWPGFPVAAATRITWEKQPVGKYPQGLLSVIAYGKGTFVAVSNTLSHDPPAGVDTYEVNVFTSTDGVRWKSPVVTKRAHGSIRHLRFVNNQFVMVGEGGTAFSSPDGVTWTEVSTGNTNDLLDIAYGQGRYVILGYSNTDRRTFLLTSPNLVRWEAHDPGLKYFDTITFAGGQFVAGGFGLAASRDGIQWTTLDIKLCDGCQVRDVVFGKNYLVALASYLGEGADGELLASTDGITWNVVHRNGHSQVRGYGLAYGNGVFIAFSEGQAKLSSDGVHWEIDDKLDTSRFTAIVFGNGTFVAISPGEPVVLVGTTSGNSSGDVCLSFADVSADHRVCPALQKLVPTKAISGYSDGTFKPGNPVTRAEFAKMLVVAMGQPPRPDRTLTFTDVAGHWAAVGGYLQAAVDMQVVNGFEDGTFRPEDLITRAQLVKIAAAAAGLKPSGAPAYEDVRSSEWYAGWVASARNAHLVGESAPYQLWTEPRFEPDRAATREEAAMLLANLIAIRSR